MAIEKHLESASLILKLENGKDSKGNNVYKNKTFSNISTSATNEQLYATGVAISNILSNATIDIKVRENSFLVESNN